jgi:hypothetical protein
MLQSIAYYEQKVPEEWLNSNYFGYIYIIYDQKHKLGYVGKKEDKIEKTKNYYGSGTIIKKKLKARGKYFFKKIILGIGYNREELEKYEKECKLLFNTTNKKYGYNILLTDGHGTAGYKHTESTKKEIGLSSSKRQKGKPKSKEHRKSISKSQKGKSWKERMSSEKYIQNMQNAKRPIEEKWPKESVDSFREKTSKSYDEKFGKEKSNEIKRKQSISRSGLPQSDEKRRKCSIAKIKELNPQFKKIPKNIQKEIIQLFLEEKSLRKISKLVYFSSYKVKRFLIENNYNAEKITW